MVALRVRESGAELVEQMVASMVALLAVEKGFLWVALMETEMDLNLAVDWDALLVVESERLMVYERVARMALLKAEWMDILLVGRLVDQWD